MFWEVFSAVVLAVSAFIITSFGFLRIKRYFNARQLRQSIRPEWPTIQFSDLIGFEKLKERLQPIVHVLKNDPLNHHYLPRLLICGDPQTGKTTWARAIAGEGQCPLFRIDQEILQERDSISRLKAIFCQVRRHQPCVVLLDRINFINGDERSMVVVRDAILEMCRSLKRTDQILLIAELQGRFSDYNIWQYPGHFDTTIYLERPSFGVRKKFLMSRFRDQFAVDRLSCLPTQKIDWSWLAQLTWQCSFPMLDAIMDRLAAWDDWDNVAPTTFMDRFEDAFEELTHGINTFDPHSVTPSERERIAIHEAGHTLVARLLRPEWRLQRVRIDFNTARARGYHRDVPPPSQEAGSDCERDCRIGLMITLGAWAAERVIYGDNSCGVSGDLQFLTDLARDMTLEYGMGRLGPVFIPKDKAELAKEAILALIQEVREDVLRLVEEYRELVIAIRDALLQKGMLNHHQVEAIISEYRAKNPDKFSDWSFSHSGGPHAHSEDVSQSKLLGAG